MLYSCTHVATVSVKGLRIASATASFSIVRCLGKYYKYRDNSIRTVKKLAVAQCGSCSLLLWPPEKFLD